MAQQTINVGTAPNDGTGTPLRTAFQYTNSNFSELYTAVGPSGNNIVVPGNATISGDLTVDTSTLKVDSANNRVGIGTASPSYTLDVTSSATTVIRSLASAGNQAYVSVAGNGGVVGASSLDLIQDGSSNAFIYNRANAYLAFGTNNTERLRIDTSGNVGIGVTPANWATIKALQVGAGASLFGYTATEAALSGNTYYNAGFKYVANGQATQYQQQIGEHRWYTAPSGTAGNAITFTQAMTLDAAGNLGIGVTPSAWRSTVRALQIGGVGALYGSTATTGAVSLSRNAYDSATGGTYISNDEATLYEQDQLGRHVWYNAPAGTGAISWQQAMTLDASGNLLIGATAVYANERIRSKTTTTNYWSINMESVNRGWLNRQSDANGGIAAFFEVGASNTNVGSITTTASATSYTSASDYRLKEAVQPLVGGLARISALKPSIYKWKINGSNGEGFLAHELAEVVPLAVTGEKDAVNEDGSIKAQGVDLSKVVPVLVAAIQELAAEVNALKNA